MCVVPLPFRATVAPGVLLLLLLAGGVWHYTSVVRGVNPDRYPPSFTIGRSALEVVKDEGARCYWVQL